MDNLDWCRKQRQGIRLIEPNSNLYKEYIENAEESIRVISKIKDTQSNVWLATTKYYIEYFAAYAFLMRVGIKSEIHKCTIEIFRQLENKNIIDFKVANRLERDKALRIDNQYYLKNKPVHVDLEDLREFVLTIKQAADSLSSEDLSKIRNAIY